MPAVDYLGESNGPLIYVEQSRNSYEEQQLRDMLALNVNLDVLFHRVRIDSPKKNNFHAIQDNAERSFTDSCIDRIWKIFTCNFRG